MANLLTDEQLNITNWTQNVTPTTFSNSYANGVNTLTYCGAGGLWERIYIPVTVKANTGYKFSFNFNSPTGFGLDCYDNFGSEYALVSASVPSANAGTDTISNLSRSADLINSASDTPKYYHVDFNSGSNTTVYLTLDFGFMRDGQTATLIFSNLSCEEYTIPTTFNSIDEIMNTTAGMTAYRSNSKNDDSTDSVTGVSWFKYSSVSSSTIYVCGNNWIGFGRSSEQLKIWRRDGATYYVLYQTGTIKGTTNFLKIRVHGYVAYSSTSASDALIYEVFIFSDGRMFVNIIRTPSSSRSDITNALVCGSTTLSLTIGTNDTCPIYITLTPTDATTGTGWSAKYEKITFDTIRYLVKSGTTYYTIVDGALSSLSDVTDLTASVFTEHGTSAIPTSALLITLASPTVYKWSDGQTISNLTATVTALPPNQTVITENFDMTDSTILGIEKVTADSDDNTLYAVSFDDGTTWYAYVNSAWAVLTEAQSGMTKATLNGIGSDAWATMATTGHYKFRFVLFENSYVNSVVVDYLN